MDRSDDRQKIFSLTTRLFILLLAIVSTKIFGQTDTIIIKKETPETVPYVTLAGTNIGKRSVKEVTNAKFLKLTEKATELKIISFTASIMNNGSLKEFSMKGDSLTKNFIKEINNVNFSTGKSPRLYIENVRALRPQKDTVFLNVIVLILTE